MSAAISYLDYCTSFEGSKCRGFSAMTLHYETVGETQSPKSKILFLHGLLGNGRNLKTFAKKVCEQKSSMGYLMDLRGHGQSRLDASSLTDNKHSFSDCVQDILQTLPPQSDQTPHMVVGHSWGGRMALQYAATTIASNNSHSNLQRVWLLDTVPGQPHESVAQVIHAVDEIAQEHLLSPIKDKKDLIQRLTQAPYHINMAIAQWLASSYRNNGDFGFDLDVAKGVLQHFDQQDFYGLLQELLLKGVQVDMVRGGKNLAWEISILQKLEALSKTHPQLFRVHVLPQAGHWVHTEDLKGLVGLFAKY